LLLTISVADVPQAISYRLVLIARQLLLVLAGTGVAGTGGGSTGVAGTGELATPASVPGELEFQNNGLVTLSGNTMGPIEFHVTVTSNEYHSLNSPDFRGTVRNELESVNRSMSTYIDSSDVSRFNRQQTTDWFAVDATTCEVVTRAQRISALTNGAFDITVGPLVSLWNFGAGQTSTREFQIPSDQQIERARQTTGYEKLQVRLDPPALKKETPQLQIDLSAIAKGYAVDRVADALQQIGFSNLLVEIGGEVRAVGQRPDNSPWKIGVREPTPLITTVRRRVELADQAMATSGDYENFHQVGNQTFSHTIDPASGRPVQHPLTSISIIADDCLTADAIATAVLVMGPERGRAFCDDQGFEYLMILRTEPGRLTDIASANFPWMKLQRPQMGWGSSFLATVLVFLLVVTAMAVGVIFGRRRISGSCGGIASLQAGAVKPECSLCSRPSQQCSELKKALEKRRQTTA